MNVDMDPWKILKKLRSRGAVSVPILYDKSVLAVGPSTLGGIRQGESAPRLVLTV